MDVSRETTDRLNRFSELALKWTRVINLISKTTEADIWKRHIEDSAQLYDLAGEGAHWVDLGSGGGFPGIVIAIIALEKHPDRRFTLVESDRRKCAFLREATRLCNLKVDVISERIEAVAPLGGDILSARALAPLDHLLGFAARHRQGDGKAVFPKGVNYAEEIAEAARTWHFDPVIHPSITDPAGVIVEVRNFSHV
ncbi:16S rRNA (guanine(527)-N(7))-methyltransferase RsmG [Falsirhodobacter deserti]|uniref:16S rRNA (guanine(527)-N(7))-methyltransferase RsmG n=1 Tax=Falsirhodobacter deserti TaxID=1365611 RepID=UPI001F4EA8D8|nr:16S rRNA (guanine(527)-N(7))-methyltransferase RsmG [Falsirhodobacter deserti]